MENTQFFVAPTRGDIGEALLRCYLPVPADVTNGLLATFTVCQGERRELYYAPRRLVLFVFLALGPNLTDYQLGAVGQGHAMRLEYSDCHNPAYVVGVYELAAYRVALRGIAHYYRKMARYKEREKAGLRREIEMLRRENDILLSGIEHGEAFMLYVEGGCYA